MEIQRQSEAFAYRLAAPPVSRHYSTKVLQGIHKTAADLVKDYTDNLYKEFHDWIDQQEFWPRGDTVPTDYTQPMGGPLTYWDNIEAFMKEKYPAAYRGYSYGQEQAAPALDGYGMVFPVYPRQERTIPYETGPEAVSKYGYDPRQVAAGFMYLHSKAHNTARPTSRTNRIPRDIDRLSDIFQKRVEMQEKARQRKLVNANTIRCATDDYRGYHRGPDADYGSSMDNPDGVFPDIDTHPEYYDTYQPYDYESHHQIRRVRGKPDSWVTVYRALPLSVLQHKTYRGGPNDLYEGSKPYSYRQREAPINTNDWVTPSYSYAQEHGEANLSNEPWTIVQQRVRARSLFSEGNSIHEWAYNGEPIVGTEGDRARRERGLRTRKTKRSNTIRCAMPMMYHRTEPEWAKSIYEDKEFGGPNSVWFSDRPTGEGEVYGPAIVQLNIPDEVLKNHGEVEGEFPSGEKHWRVDLDAIKPEYFVDRAIKEARKLLSHNTIRCAMDDDYDELYHLTDNPDFALDPDYIPSTLGEEGGPGIYLTDDPGHWAGTNVDKPYVATFRVPAGYDEMFDPDYGHEGSYFVPHDLFDLIELAQVSPRKKLSHNTIRCATLPVRDLIHYTRPHNVPDIMANGFHAGRGEGGYGVYFTPAGTDYPDLNYGEHVPIHAQFQPVNTLMMTGDKDDPGYQQYVEATYKNYQRPDIPLSEQGYDSIEYHDPWGATQFIVFDPTKIKTLGQIGPDSPYYHPPRNIHSHNTIRCDGGSVRDSYD